MDKYNALIGYYGSNKLYSYNLYAENDLEALILIAKKCYDVNVVKRNGVFYNSENKKFTKKEALIILSQNENHIYRIINTTLNKNVLVNDYFYVEENLLDDIDEEW